MNPELIYTADVDAYGAGRHSLAPRCRSGELLRIRAGVYVPSGVWHQLSVWERNRTRIRAAVERGPRSRILIQQSAAPFWGLPVLGTSDSIMLLAVPPSHGRKRGDLRWTVRKLLEPVTEMAGVRLTSRVQTVLDMAAYLEFERAVPAMDHVLRPDPAHGLPALPKERLWELAEDLPGLTRQNRAKQVIDFADRRSESPGESYSRAMLHRHGFPEPELQHEFVTSAGRFRTDFFWKDQSLVGEFDGAVKYGRGPAAEAPSWDTLLQEKRREDAIRATGVGFVRWSWTDGGKPAQHPDGLVQRLMSAGLPRLPRRRSSR